MPQRPQRPCRHKGCRDLHRNANGFCAAHQDDVKAWARTPKSAETRITGRPLQARRMRIWSRCPLCAACGRLTDIDPKATWRFELDHIVRLADDGEDTDANCQLLCVSRDAQGVKVGCHAEKTAREQRRG